MSRKKIPINWKQYAISAVISSLAATIVAVLVGNSLAEITFSIIFSIMFCFVFQLFALMLLVLSLTNEEVTPIERTILLCFAGLICFSGIVTLILDINLLPILSFLVKIPLYTLVGISLCFTLTYAAIEIIRRAPSLGCCFPMDSMGKMIKPLVSSPFQIYFLGFQSVVLGAFFGLLFGLLDIGEDRFLLHSRFLFQQVFTVPVSAIFGFFSGILSCYVKTLEEAKIGEFETVDEENQN